MSDRSIKEKLNGLSDEELYKLIRSVCIAVGMDSAKENALISDIPRLRRMLGALNDKQIASLMTSLGAEERSELAKRLGGG